MREKKIREMNTKSVYRHLRHDELILIQRYCNADLDKARELLREYNLDSSDLDVINHLGKIKTKHLTILKKECRERMKTNL